jgi:Flp pilus assembly pilin Flp
MFSFSSKSRREQGHGLFKYVMILALIAIVIIGLMKMLGPAIGDTFSTVNVSHGSGSGQIVITGSFQSDDLYWNNPANGCKKNYTYGTNFGCDQIADRVQACLAGATGSYCDDYFAVAPR